MKLRVEINMNEVSLKRRITLHLDEFHQKRIDMETCCDLIYLEIQKFLPKKEEEPSLSFNEAIDKMFM
jgi:hypothetical protein